MTATSSTTCMAYRKHQSSITSNSSTWSQCSIPDTDWSRLNSDGSSHSMVSTPTTIEPSTLKMVNRNVQCNTTRRKRSRSNSRRFVITELPLDPGWYHSDVGHDDDEEENDSTMNQSETASICSSDDVITSECPSGTQALCHPRPNKTEVRGRFTIIDLSPEFPQTTSEDSTSPPEKGSSTTVRRPVRALPRRCVAPTPIMTAPELHPPLQSPVFDNDSLLDMARNQLHQHTQHLRAFDRHLEHLLQESSDMKALLESMVSSNSRWIEALAKSTSTQDNSIQRDTQRILQREEEQISEKLKINELSPPPCVQTSIDDQLAALQGAYHELDLKYETLVRQNTQIERSNIMLEARLRQEMTLNDELRAHVDQLTQYTESLILTVDTFPECDEKDVPDECLDEKLKLCHLAAECSTPKSRRRRRNSLVTVITMEDDSSDENIVPCPLTAPSSGGSSSNQTAPSSNTSVDQHESTWSFCHFGSNQSLVGCDDVAENESVDNDDRHNDVSLQCDDIEDWTVADGRELMMVTTQESSNQMGEMSSIAKDRRPFFPSHFLPTTAKTHSEKPICLRRGPPSPEKSTLSLLASPNAVFRQIRLAPR